MTCGYRSRLFTKNVASSRGDAVTKVAGAAIDRFLKQPPPEMRAVLLYGPDEGMARERMVTLARSVVPDPDDPFRLAELDADGLTSDPARLGDEAAAIAMGGGRRVGMVRGLSDRAAGPVISFVEAPVGDALVLVTAGDLPPRSKLRKAFEASKQSAAIACYLDDAGGVERLIDDGLRPLKVRIDEEARRYLVDNLGSDRGISRSEIDKLALYAGEGGHLDLETVSALIGDSAAVTSDDAVFAMLGGKADTVERALELAKAEGVSPIALLRAAGSQMYRIRRVQDSVRTGMNLNAAVDSLKPKVFFKLRAPFEAVCRDQPPQKVHDAIDLVLGAEAACKRTGAPDWLLCHRCLHQVTALFRQTMRGGRPPAQRGRR